MKLLACVSVCVLLGRSLSAAGECRYDEVRCGDSDQCCARSSLCDGLVSCDNLWDELNCTSCNADSFLCDGSHCVKDRHKCDGVAWCKDGSDEANCSTMKTFPACLARSRCNGVWGDCLSWDDEVGCTPDMCQAPATREAYSNGRCHDPNGRCNGIRNFSDEEDEENCTECRGGALFCDGRCLSPHQICDGTGNCRSGADEVNCTSCKEGSFLCDGTHCVKNVFHRCDGFAWCGDGTDEANCSDIEKNAFSMPSSRCNGIQDFYWTKDDEIACTPDMCQEPASNSTYCDGRCQKASRWCDGQPDCADGQDETGCPGTLSPALTGS